MYHVFSAFYILTVFRNTMFMEAWHANGLVQVHFHNNIFMVRWFSIQIKYKGHCHQILSPLWQLAYHLT